MLWVLAWYLLVSLVTFTIYGYDKHQARSQKWRIKESLLHTVELLGGWPGAFIAQRAFHHKWKKTRFMLVFWLIVALHVIAWAVIFYQCLRS